MNHKLTKQQQTELKRLERDKRMEGNMLKEEQLMWKVLQGEELSETEQETWNRFHFIIDLRLIGYAKHRIVKLVADKYGLSLMQCYNLYNQAANLFFLQSQINHDAERAFLSEQLMDLAARAKLDGNFEFAAKCIMDAGKVMGLNKTEKDQEPPQMPIIIFTNDAGSLHPEDETQDADFEIQSTPSLPQSKTD